MSPPAQSKRVVRRRPAPVEPAYRGGKFVFDLYDDDERPVWGTPGRALWAPGEGLMLVGGQGVGKTTLAQQLVLARIGVRDATLLDQPVERLSGRQSLLYLAMDRPRQIQRSLRRMVSEADRPKLDRRLRVYAAPLSHLNIVKQPASLLRWIEKDHQDVSDVFVDSLKDLAVGLSDADAGAAVNSALNGVVASGRQLVVLHHQRKSQQNNKHPEALDDVHGSNWLTAGMGSVVLLKGEPGASAVELRHLKQPGESVGPLHVVHDPQTGTSRVGDAERGVLEVLLEAGTNGATLEQVAFGVYYSNKDADQQKARRELNKLVQEGGVQKIATGSSGGKGGGGAPARWAAR